MKDEAVNKVFDPVRELEEKLKQAQDYYKGCASDVMSLTSRLTTAKAITKAAKLERDIMQRAVNCLKRSGFQS